MFLDSEEELADEDFSRLLSPLRKGRFKMATVERKMMLLLNNQGTVAPAAARAR